MFYILGVDPGNAGAFALVDFRGELVEVWDMPLVTLGKRNQVSAALVANILADVLRARLHEYNMICYMEKVGAMPKDGSVQAFAFGRGVGVIEGCLASTGVPLQRVAPNIWKAQMGLTGAHKNASRARVIERYPNMAEMFKRKKDDGRAEAVLIALWGLQKMKREQAKTSKTPWDYLRENTL